MTKPTGFKQGAPCWVDLGTKDIEAAKTFYTKLFGWEYDAVPMGPDMTYYMAKIDGNLVAGLSQMPPDMIDHFPAVWGSHFAVDSVDETAERIKAAGGNIVMGPDDIPNSGRIVMATDPTGAMIGFWEAKEHKGFGVMNEPGSYIWAELLTDNPEGAVPFYEKVLGIKTETAPYGDVGDYTVFKVTDDDNGSAGLMKKPMPDMPNSWMVYFTVTSTDAAVAKTQELGGSVMMPAMDLPDVGRMAVLSDPVGSPFCILEPAPM